MIGAVLINEKCNWEVTEALVFFYLDLLERGLQCFECRAALLLLFFGNTKGVDKVNIENESKDSCFFLS